MAHIIRGPNQSEFKVHALIEHDGKHYNLVVSGEGLQDYLRRSDTDFLGMFEESKRRCLEIAARKIDAKQIEKDTVRVFSADLLGAR